MTSKKKLFKNSFSSINVTVFLLSFFLGLFYTYFFDNKINVTVYPTPYNKDKINFKDNANNCYKYNIEEVKCPDDKNKINSLPLS